MQKLLHFFHHDDPPNHGEQRTTDGIKFKEGISEYHKMRYIEILNRKKIIDEKIEAALQVDTDMPVTHK